MTAQSKIVNIGRDVLGGLVGAERRANDGADSAGALGLADELDDRFCNIVRA